MIDALTDNDFDAINEIEPGLMHTMRLHGEIYVTEGQLARIIQACRADLLESLEWALDHLSEYEAYGPNELKHRDVLISAQPRTQG